MASLSEPLGIFSTLRKRAQSFAERHPSMARRFLGLQPLGIAAKSHMIEIDLGKGTRTVRTLDGPTKAKAFRRPPPKRPVYKLTSIEYRKSGPVVKSLRPSFGNATIQVVCEAFGVRHQDVISECRLRRHCYPRFAIVKLIRDREGSSFTQIGWFLGRDHTTCMAAYERATDLHDNDPSWRALFDKASGLLDAATKQTAAAP